MDIGYPKIKAKINEDVNMKAKGKKELTTFERLRLSEYEKNLIRVMMIMAFLNMCNKLGQVELHTLSRVYNLTPQ